MRRVTQLLLVSAATLCVSLPAVAMAQPGSDDDSARSGSAGGATVYDFEDDNVDGEVLSPDGALITGRGRSKHANMITIRPHFIPELIKMANDI